MYKFKGIKEILYRKFKKIKIFVLFVRVKYFYVSDKSTVRNCDFSGMLETGNILSGI